MESDRESIEKVIHWHAQFGDPNGPEYLTLDEVNAGFELVDALKSRVATEETMTTLLHFFGLHPPSMIEYADNLATDLIRQHHGPAFAWLDGINCGMAIMLMAILTRDEAEAT